MKEAAELPPAHIAVCGGSQVLAQLLWNRGVRSVEEIKKCLGANRYIGTPPASLLYNAERGEGQKNEPREPEVSVALPAIDEKLMRGLYRLAAVCVDALIPVFVCPAVRLVNATAHGLARRHARMLIEDERGEQLPADWWDMSPSLVPKGWGDAVFCLRVDDRFGRLEVRAELMAFKENSSAKEDVSSVCTPPSFAVEDWRRADGVLDKVLGLQEAQIWREGDDGEDIANGRRRDELVTGLPLVIWTPPPSPDVLRTALEHVQPEKLWICAYSLPAVDPGDFLRVLGGMTKAVIARRDGRIDRVELAARLGQTEGVLLAGLDVLESKGLLRYRAVEERILCERGDGKQRESTSGQPLVEMLREVAAYRRYIGEVALAEWLC